MEYSCYYCEMGYVETLPSKCPECGVNLTKPWVEMTDAEKLWAANAKVSKLMESQSVMTLAC